jgi:uncharacterized protein (TIGR00730 family)
MKNPNKTVAMIGSASAVAGSFLWSDAYSAGLLLGNSGWTVAHGGNVGLMHAAALGAAKGGANWLAGRDPEEDHPPISVLAYSDYLSNEERAIPRPDKDLSNQQYFTRLDSLLQCDAFIAMPGGYGTMLEIMLIAQAMQTKRISKKPFYVCGREHRHTLQIMMRDARKADYIGPGDIFHEYVDYPTEAANKLCMLAMFADIQPL